MYIPCILQVVFPYFEKMKNNKKPKRGQKSPKRKIKGLRKIYSPKEKE